MRSASGWRRSWPPYSVYAKQHLFRSSLLVHTTVNLAVTSRPRIWGGGHRILQRFERCTRRSLCKRLGVIVYDRIKPAASARALEPLAILPGAVASHLSSIANPAAGTAELIACGKEILSADDTPRPLLQFDRRTSCNGLSQSTVGLCCAPSQTLIHQRAIGWISFAGRSGDMRRHAEFIAPSRRRNRSGFIHPDLVMNQKAGGVSLQAAIPFTGNGGAFFWLWPRRGIELAHCLRGVCR